MKSVCDKYGALFILDEVSLGVKYNSTCDQYAFVTLGHERDGP